MEQKNNVVVRTWIGYARFDTSQERTLMNGLYDLHRLYFNFFQPQMKLVEKTRSGAKVRRRYDTPQTPYQRLSASSVLDQSGRAALETAYQALNPAQLNASAAGDVLRRLTGRDTLLVASETDLDLRREIKRIYDGMPEQIDVDGNLVILPVTQHDGLYGDHLVEYHERVGNFYDTRLATRKATLLPVS